MSTTTGALTRAGSAGIRFWLFLLALALIALVANTFYSGQKNDQDRKAATRITDVQVLSQQIATYAREAAGGNLDSFEELKATRFWFKVKLDAGATAALRASASPAVRLTLGLRRNGLG